MADEVRVGFIGCGGNAAGHMRQVKQDPLARIVAVCDVAEEAAQRAAAEHGARAFTHHKAMLDACKLDAVYLSIPVAAHGEPELDVLDAGLPFFVEKPVAINLAIAHRVAARIRKTKTLTCVGYQLRYAQSARCTRAFLAGQTIGMAVGRYLCGTGRGTGWLRQFAQSGGQIVEQATHSIDMMRFLCGEVVEVYSAQASRTLKSIDCYDHGATVFKFASGAVGCLTTCWALDNSVWDANIVDIFFDRYRLTWNYQQPSIMPANEAFKVDDAPVKTIDQVFIEAVRTGDRSAILTPYEDAVKSLAVSLAANDSARDGSPKRVGGREL